MGISSSKITLILVLIVSLIAIPGCGKNSKSEKSESSKSYASAMPEEDTVDELLGKSKESNTNANAIKNNIENIVKTQVSAYSNLVADSITVMSLQGTDNADDYTVRCYITMSSASAASTAYDTIASFTKELAGKLDSYSTVTGELSVAWTVPNITGSGRITYKKNNGTLELSTEDFDDNLKVDEGVTP